MHGAEERLWRTVIIRAIMDAFTDPRKLKKSASAISAGEIKYSRWWLRTDTNDLRAVCDWAGISAEVILEWAREMEKKGWPLSEYRAARKRLTQARRDEVLARIADRKAWT